ncbi:MAG: preprotein translocase subunit SecE [Gammaproteobacteria bacterium]|nr:preprotein translocase subunit SecE [Gammaproteobacteria bacterium]
MANNKIEKSKGKNVKPDKQSVGESSKYSIASIRQFIIEVQNEFNKIAWPGRKQTVGSTVLVTLFVIMVSFYLGAVDLLLGKIVEAVLR